MGSFREIEIGFINIICVRIRSKDVQQMFNRILGGGTNIGPYWYPPSYPHPQRQQTSPARGQTNCNESIYFLLFSIVFMQKGSKSC